MKVPHTLCPHTFSVYCPAPGPPLLPGQRDGITAANLTWDRDSPAPLERLVLRALAHNIKEWCPWLLQALGPEHLSVVLEELSLDLPLTFCIRNVPDGFYWQRRALASWPGPEDEVCDVAGHGRSWRRLVLERQVEALLEKQPPCLELDGALRTSLREAAPHVRRLRLRELQAGPVQAAVSRDQLEAGHLLLGPVLALLPALEELQVRSGPKDCALQFAWALFALSHVDASSLNQGLRTCQSLSKLKICCSHVTDHTLEVLLLLQAPPPCERAADAAADAAAEGDTESDEDASGAAPEVAPAPAAAVNFSKLLPKLSRLDLSHNELQDAAADILATFLHSRPSVTHLRLINNKIGSRGAESLASCLDSCSLTELDLSLNSLGEAGGVALAQHCGKLRQLRLAGCGLGLRAAKAFAVALGHSDLTSLDLSNNFLTEEAGFIFHDALIKKKGSLQEMDLRMTGIQEDNRQLIIEILRNSV